jgi:hypothetical protein
MEERHESIRAVIHQATIAWARATQGHVLAPPDDEFARRMQQLAFAAAEQEIVWRQAHELGLKWRPLKPSASMAPPYELRPGSGRRGPADLWGTFDSAVTAMNEAIVHDDAADVADAFGAVTLASSAIARSLES